MHAVYRIDWTEYERGWGSRPDGYTLYPSREDADRAFNKAYEGREGRVPDEYVNPSIPRLVEVAKTIYDEVQGLPNGQYHR